MEHIRQQNAGHYGHTVTHAKSVLGKRAKTTSPGGPVRDLTHLLETFPTLVLATPTPLGALNDFVPASQCVDFRIFPDTYSSAKIDFPWMSTVMRNYTRTARNAIESLLWEPFFAGQHLPSRSTTVKLSKEHRAAAYWFSDFILARSIREATPRGEIMPSEGPQQLHCFHPYRALHAKGVRNQDQALAVYLQGFTATASASSNLARALGKFYSAEIPNATKSLALHDGLVNAGIYTEFYRRFCALTNIPTAAPDGVSPQTLSAVLSRLSALPAKLRTQIKLRRALQTRAYFALCTRHLLHQDQCFSHKPLNIKLTIEELESYLDDLQLLLQSLCKSASLATIDLGIRKADQLYGNTVGRRLAKSQTWVGSRILLNRKFHHNPTMELGHSYKINNGAELAEYANGLVLKLAMPSVSIYAAPKASEAVLKLAIQTRNLATAVHARSTPADLRRLSRKCEELLKSDLVVTKWSAPLSANQPINNCFRELLFWAECEGEDT